MKNVLLSCITGASLLLVSCTPSATDTLPKSGQGSISFGVNARTEFTRAVDESEYANTDNYTVDILKMPEEEKVHTFKYKDKTASYKLDNGSYLIKAYYGETYKKDIKSTKGFYVEGSKRFTVNADQQQLEIECKPTCGRLKTIFDESMDEDFTSYYVVYETQALTAADENINWSKTNSDPYYVLLNPEGEVVKATIHITRASDGKSTTVIKDYAMTPGQSWTMNIAPKDGSGSMGITITIDETATEYPEKEIVIPSDWI